VFPDPPHYPKSCQLVSTHPKTAMKNGEPLSGTRPSVLRGDAPLAVMAYPGSGNSFSLANSGLGVLPYQRNSPEQITPFAVFQESASMKKTDFWASMAPYLR